MPPLPDSAKPRLVGHARRRLDPVNGRPLLLYPEGALELDETAAATLDLCDGARTLTEIVQELAGSYEAPVEEIHGDVTALLQDLASKGLLRWEGSAE